MTLDEIVGGAPYGATTIAGGQGQRLPTKLELDGARHQGELIARAPPKCRPRLQRQLNAQNWPLADFSRAGARGMSPAEHASLRWTHNRTSTFRTSCFGSRADVFQRSRCANAIHRAAISLQGKNWRLGCAGRPNLASMRAGASCLFISMSELFAVLASSPANPTVRPA